MKTKNIILIALLSLLAGFASCKKDHDIPTGKVFNTSGGGGTKEYTISISINPSEGGTVSGGGTYQQGQSCTVIATANDGYAFTNWTEGGNTVSDEANYSFTVEGNRTLVANFTELQPDEYAISVLANPSNWGTVSGSGTYQKWQSCTVTATANESYTFINWTENGNQVSTNANYTFTVESDRTLVANFSVCDHSNIILNELNGDTKFIEIYNKGDMDLSLEGMYLMKDDYATGAIWTADATIIAPAHSYVVLYSFDVQADHPELGDNMFFNSGLSSKKTIRIALFRPDGTERDVFMRGTTGEWGMTVSNVAPQSYARTPDGGDWKLADPTPGTANPATGEDIPDTNLPNNYTITVSVNLIEGGSVMGGGTYQEGLSCTVTATPNSGYTFSNWTEGGTVVSTNASYTFTVTGNRTLVANFTYNGGGSHEYVDLGLPSGLLWATCNVGADSPEDYGDYFAWAETTTKSVYNWSTYQYCMGSDNTLTKYCNNASYGYNGYTDNLTVLQAGDDAATANWGSDWRMPTKEEWQELLNNTTHTWTTQNGVNGRLFTASNGQGLFLPAAGYRNESSLGYVGSYGYYWSSSLNTGYPSDAWYFYFNSGNYGMDISGRYYGPSVRAVRSARQN